MIRLSPILAMLFGALFFASALHALLVDLQAVWWSSLIIAAMLLIFGGQRAYLRGTVRWLASAWGFTSGSFYLSFFGAATNETPRLITATIPMLGVLMPVSLTGYFLAITGNRSHARDNH